MKRKVFVALILVFALSFSTALAGTNEKVTLSKKHGTPEFIAGELTKPSKEKAEDIVFSYLKENKNKFKFTGESSKEAFKIISKSKDDLGYTYLRLQQEYKGVPVFGSTQTVHINKDGVLTSFSGAVIPDIDKHKKLKLEKKINSKEAISIAEADLGISPEYVVSPTGILMVYLYEDEARYVYLVRLNFLNPEPGNWYYFVDASTKEIVNKFNAFYTKKTSSIPTTGEDKIGTGIGVLGDTKDINTLLSSSSYYLIDRTRGNHIQTFDGNSRTRLPGSIWIDSDNNLIDSYDNAAVDAHKYAALTYDYFSDVFGRNSFDGNGATIKSTVHYGRNYNNAGWTGYQMVFGDGDGTLFRELSGSLDVMAHELTHAVTQYTADLIYQDESGAINEAMSDVFGTAVEFWANNNPDWLLGEDIYTPNISGDALRSMENPTDSGDPDHYDDRYTGTEDYGGVHTNSGIINKAAYLISEGGTHYGVNVNGIGIDKMTAIFYRALNQHLTQSSTFSQLRAALIQSATELYGANGSETQAINDAFDSVGVY
ncbi:M4 family metallopeptidase [Wukongibacter sp. M2B1]|uniref:M4 family metallopeptidase n=1 Tax=Wukongibacter sp. M2B1 TaxID=3088895 RepID=UPI003D7B17F2